jgi:hypothetical protein
VGLSNAAVKNYHTKPFKKSSAINICPGPNIAYFTEIVSLQKMIDHIYGRTNIIRHANRPHMFVKELRLYVDYWAELITETSGTIDNKRKAYLQQFYDNLMNGISYYRTLTDQVTDEFSALKNTVQEGLDNAEDELNGYLATLAGRMMHPVLSSEY